MSEGGLACILIVVYASCSHTYTHNHLYHTHTHIYTHSHIPHTHSHSHTHTLHYGNYLPVDNFHLPVRVTVDFCCVDYGSTNIYIITLARYNWCAEV